MITYYSVFLILATGGVRCRYLLKEYAPDHDNYESYSFAYGVSDPVSGDHKHQWERREQGHVQGEYGLMEPDGMMRLVQYTAGPHQGFQATVKKLAVHVAHPEFTQETKLYQQKEEFKGARYAAEDSSGLKEIQQNKENIPENPQPKYVQVDYGQKVNKIETDYGNQESQHHTILTRSTGNQNRRKKEQSLSTNRRKQIVKKNIETELHLPESGFAVGGSEYISNFNMNPVNIDELHISEGEKKILHGLSTLQDNHQHRIISTSLHNPRPFHIHNNAPVIHPSIIEFQKQIGNSNFHGYQFTPNHHTLPLIQSNPHIQAIPQDVPTNIPDIKTQEQIEGYDHDKRFHNALSLIHNHPEIKTRLEYFQNFHNIHQEQPIFQIPHQQQNYQDKEVENYNLQQIPIQGSSMYEPTLEGKRYNNENQTADEKEQERQYLLGLRPLNNPSQSETNQNMPRQTYKTNGNQNYEPYHQHHQEISYENTKLNSQDHYPVVLVDAKAKLGLPFYPSSKEIHQIPLQEYNYEDIPIYSPNLEGKRFNTENQTAEQKEEERQYLLGLNPGPLFPPPPGYTRETIWQAGDPDADPEPEVLVRQLNETCAYIQMNETTPGTEDGRANIWQAGDYSAQRQEEELIRSVNITCENYTADAMTNFSSGYTVVDYCWQCVKNDGLEYENNEEENKASYNPNNYGENKEEQQQTAYEPNDGRNQQQQQQQQVIYVQKVGNNEQHQQQYEQNQQNYETNVEKYTQVVNNSPQSYNQNSQTGGNNYQQGDGPMKMVIYPNFGYRNDPESGQYGLYRRRSTEQLNTANVSYKL